MEREVVITWLRTLGPAGLADLLYEVWDDWPRTPGDYYEPNHMPTGQSRHVMAEVSIFDGWLENREPPRCNIAIVSRAAEGKPFAGAENLQSGECPQCKARVICWAKDADCPACGASCFLT